jgi:thiol-disulfide isomerase/thioredoxin
MLQTMLRIRRAGLRLLLAAFVAGIATAAHSRAMAAVESMGQATGGEQNTLEVSQALAQGDAFTAQKQYDKALEAYHHADKLSHHTCASCLLRIASIERRAGDMEDALDSAKKAAAAAGANKVLAAQAHLLRGAMLTTMASKPGDKKLKEAEEEFRTTLALNPTLAEGHRDLGVALIRQGRDAEGIAELNLFIATPGNRARLVEEARAIVADPIRAREPFAPNFGFTSMEGAQVSNTAMRGKVVLLDFWATWCPPCRESLPTMQALHKKYADKAFEIVGISADGDESTLQAFVEQNRMSWPEYLDISGSVQYAFDVDSFPTYIVVDKEGVVRYRQSGFGPTVGGELEDTINKALKKPYTPPTLTSASASSPPSVAAPPAPVEAKVAAVAANQAPSPLAAVSDTAAKPAEAAPGGVYHNGALGFSYPYPQGWTVANAEMIRNANASMKQMNAGANAKGQAPGDASAGLSELIFYAYGGPKNDAKNDGTFRAVPSVRITSLESFGAMLTPEVMKRSAGAQVNIGMKMIREPEKFTVGDQNLYRMDFGDAREGQTWVSIMQTVVYDHVLTIEIFAGSPVQLDLLAATVKYSTFADADKN